MMFTMFFNKYNEEDHITREAKTIFDIFSITGGLAEMLILSLAFILGPI